MSCYTVPRYTMAVIQSPLCHARYTNTTIPWMTNVLLCLLYRVRYTVFRYIMPRYTMPVIPCPIYRARYTLATISRANYYMCIRRAKSVL